MNVSLRRRVDETIDSLSETELQQVAEYLAFVKFRSRARAMPSFDPTQLGQLYAEFAEEDRAMAAEGMPDYCAGLAAEDVR